MPRVELRASEVRRFLELRAGGKTSAECARLLGWPVGRARGVWYRYGAPAKRKAVDQTRLKTLHARGLSIPEMAARLDVSRRSVERVLKALGLRSDYRHSEAWRETCRRTYREQWRGLPKKLATVRDEVFSVRAASAGWPQAGTPRRAEVLELLATKGPLTASQVTEELGMQRQADGAPRAALSTLLRMRLAGLVEMQKRPGLRGRLFRLADGVRKFDPASEERRQGYHRTA